MSGLPSSYNAGESLLQGGTGVPIHAVQGGGGATDPSVSLLSGGETAAIVGVQGGGRVVGGFRYDPTALARVQGEIKARTTNAGARQEFNRRVAEEAKKRGTTAAVPPSAPRVPPQPPSGLRLSGNARRAARRGSEASDPLLPLQQAAPPVPTTSDEVSVRTTAGAAQQAIKRAMEHSKKIGEGLRNLRRLPSQIAAAHPLQRIAEWKGDGSPPDQIQLAGEEALAPVMLAGKIYMIRNPNSIGATGSSIQENWRNRLYTLEEINLLEDLGATQPQKLQRIFREQWPTEVAKFFNSLVKSECFKDTMLLSHRECANARTFLQKLVEGLIAEDPAYYEMRADESLGPIVELEEEKSILEGNLDGARKEIAAKIEEIRGRREAYERDYKSLIGQIRFVKRATGLPEKMTTAEIDAAIKKDPIADRKIFDAKQITTGGNISALQVGVAAAGRSGTIYLDSRDITSYFKDVLVLNKIDRRAWKGAIKATAQSGSEAERFLTEQLAALEKEYLAWDFLPA